MAAAHTNGTAANEPSKRLFYGGFDRFELELEFVQLLSNPLYLQHLASQKLLENDEFVAYLAYLQYFREPKYPGPTLKALELLQEERFRKDILVPDVVAAMIQHGFEASMTQSQST